MTSAFSEAGLAGLLCHFGCDAIALESRVSASSESATGFIRQELGIVTRDAPMAALHLCEIDVDRYDDRVSRLLSVKLIGCLQTAAVKRRAEFVAGRHCAQQALAHVGFTGESVARGDGGCPIWPVSVYGSISHHDGIAISVATTSPKTRGVGIDVQSIVSSATMADISAVILHGCDAALLASVEQHQAALAFTLIFSIKESFFKAAYPELGRYFGFDAVEIFELNLDKGSFRLRLLETLEPDLLVEGAIFGGRFIVQGRHVLSLASLNAPVTDTPGCGT